MELLLTGVNHKSGALELRESLAAVGADRALRELRERDWREAVVLSTCNRFEIYSVGEKSGDSGRLAECLERWSGGPLGEQVYRRSGADAIRHLFGVAAGLDSLVVGEAEILGQVKQAYETARAAGITGKVTNVLFQRALYVGKLVRSATGISSGQISVASVSVTLAERIFGCLKESSVLILGAGAMAESTAKHLLSGKVAKLFLTNRTWEKGQELAARLKAEAVRWEAFPPLLETVDIVIGSTGAPHPVVTRAMIEQAFPARRGRSLFLIDIAMPRDVEEIAGDLEHVYLYSLKDLEGIVQENLSQRRLEIDSARAMVRAKSDEFSAWLASVSAGVQSGLHHSAKETPSLP